MTSSNAIVIGIYGVPGCGKSFLLEQLKNDLGRDQFDFYDGSQAIANLIPGGLEAFNTFSDHEKTHWRQVAIRGIRDTCTISGRAAIVAGHFMFWSEGDEVGKTVCTAADLTTYTHIIYLDTPASTIVTQREGDTKRSRPLQSQSHLQRWKDAEKSQLQTICMDNNILFIALSRTDTICSLIRNFIHHTPAHNLALAKAKLDEILQSTSTARDGHPLETVLVLDADKTLAPTDTGSHFWELRAGSTRSDTPNTQCPLKTLFSSPMGYSYAAFRQAALLYEEIAANESEARLNADCEKISAHKKLYPEFLALLQMIAQHNHIAVVVVTCGLRRIWDKVLDNHLGEGAVQVIGSGTVSEGFVVTPEVKGALVSHLREAHHLWVWAFGDSVLDVPMMVKADRAVVVVSGGQGRSRSMDSVLERAIDHDGLCGRAFQVLLPSGPIIEPRLDAKRLPVVRFIDREFVKLITSRHKGGFDQRILHATDRPAAKLLMTPSRDSRIAGPGLREAHRQIGWYLATEFVSGIVGLEVHSIPHVQGRPTEGYRLGFEEKTSIVALMRGGEPMALGVNDAFPLAMFVHAKDVCDLKGYHVQGRETIILVDSVVNSGKSVVEFVERVRGGLGAADVQIVVVAGVVQAGSVNGGGLLGKMLERDEKLSLVALRMSDNKFTGRGGTDTGNRLFNTIQLD